MTKHISAMPDSLCFPLINFSGGLYLGNKKPLREGLIKMSSFEPWLAENQLFAAVKARLDQDIDHGRIGQCR